MLYVGELCRYLLAAPASSHDRAHRCIVATGNGLSRQVWLKFRKRFGITEIREIYRSTEGIAKFDNFTKGTLGAGMVGFAGPIKLLVEDDTFLVKYDAATGSIYRHPETGFAVLAGPDEPGEAIGRVRSMDTYPEYHKDPAATSTKLISDVFRKGDVFQRSGDLLVRDKYGWIRFHDRSGDTFRWRGENVSASEVREHISKLPDVQECSVFAVKLEGYDGQAGAAAITLGNPEEEAPFAAQLFDRLKANGLALFQMPRLVRFCAGIETTATFKQSKGSMKARSWDPDAANQTDGVYWLDGNRYVKLDTSSWGNIRSGKARL